MKIEGEHRFEKLTREQTWKLLTDPEVLKRCMPGCEKLDPVSENEFRVEVLAGVASIKGRYLGKIRMEELNPPAHLKISIEGKGTPGFLKGSGTFDLKEDGAAVCAEYRGNIQIGGTVAGVGQRMLLGVTRMMIGQLFSALEVEAASLIEAENKQEPVSPPQHGIVRDFIHSLKKR